MIHLIIDGYNLIRRVPQLSRHERHSLEQGRDALLTYLQGYKKVKRHKISVVFDGVTQMGEAPTNHKEKGIHVIYSSDVEKADHVIKRMADSERERAIIVSSDRDLTQHAYSKGCDIIDSKDFFDRMIMALAASGVVKDDVLEKEAPQHKRWTTYKKGPSRRAPKKQRRVEQRKKKL